MTFEEIALKKRPLTTDKSSLSHNYLDKVYQPFLGGLKEKDFTLLEIGVFFGYSLGVWREYFLNATIIGVDLDPLTSYIWRPNFSEEVYGPLCLAQAQHGVTTIDWEQYYSNFRGCHIIYGDATKEKTFKSITNLDVIIDDGSHRKEEILISFNILKDKLNSGGLYIIEDCPHAEVIELFSQGAEERGVELLTIYDGRNETGNPHSVALVLRKM